MRSWENRQNGQKEKNMDKKKAEEDIEVYETAIEALENVERWNYKSKNNVHGDEER